MYIPHNHDLAFLVSLLFFRPEKGPSHWNHRYIGYLGLDVYLKETLNSSILCPSKTARPAASFCRAGTTWIPMSPFLILLVIGVALGIQGVKTCPAAMASRSLWAGSLDIMDGLVGGLLLSLVKWSRWDGKSPPHQLLAPRALVLSVLAISPCL